MDRFQQYLFRDHSEAELRRWATSLRFFRYCRAYGGHANDADRFAAALRVETRADLEAVCGALGLGLTRLPADAPQPVPGRSYTGAEIASFRSRIPDFPGFEQPGRQTLASAPVRAWVQSHRLQLAIDGSDAGGYAIGERDFEAARAVDRLLEPLAERVVDPPQDDDHCLCPKHYPAWWEES